MRQSAQVHFDWLGAFRGLSSASASSVACGNLDKSKQKKQVNLTLYRRCVPEVDPRVRLLYLLSVAWSDALTNSTLARLWKMVLIVDPTPRLATCSFQG